MADPRHRDDGPALSVVVLTFNEERNLEACLTSVSSWVRDVFVVDSGSTDRTCAIAEAHGARVVRHAFDTHARQWQWALATLPLRTSWVLALDADQRVMPALRTAIEAAVDPASGEDVSGGFVNRRQVFRGRWIRHGGYYPKYLLKLFRRDRVRLDDDDLVDHHFVVDGRTRILAGDLIEDNRNEAAIGVWTAKHTRYAALQARQEVRDRARGTREPWTSMFGPPDARVRWLKQQWARLPLSVRPCLYFGYRYVLRLGFLDGREGFLFHVLQGFWYRLLVDVNIAELREGERRSGEPAGTSGAAENPVVSHGADTPVGTPDGSR
jgi:glycosyltransferase involved in cell wall biosynthesis